MYFANAALLFDVVFRFAFSESNRSKESVFSNQQINCKENLTYFLIVIRAQAKFITYSLPSIGRTDIKISRKFCVVRDTFIVLKIEPQKKSHTKQIRAATMTALTY